MKQPHITRIFSVFRHAKSMLLIFSFFLSFSNNAASQTPLQYKFTLINQTDLRITKIALAPYKLIQVHTNVNLEPGARIDLVRPDCEKMKIEIVHEKGIFSFPFMAFAHEKNVTATLVIQPNSIPVLKFEEKRNITGNNSGWKFPQILGSIPYGVGTTTIKEALKTGAKPDEKSPVELNTTLLWNNRTWNVSMIFSGNAENSTLRFMKMTSKGAYGKIPSIIHEAIMNHDYVYYSIPIEKGEKGFYVTVQMAQALERANMARQNLNSVLAKYPREVIVQSLPGKGEWVITMTQAPDMINKLTKE